MTVKSSFKPGLNLDASAKTKAETKVNTKLWF